MKGIPVQIVIAVLGLAASSTATAGMYAQQCQQAAKASDAECTGAVAAANAADGARSAATGASAGTNINNNSGSLGRDIGSQRANLNGAKTKCMAAKQQCEQKCDQAKQQAQSLPPQDPNRQDAQTIPGIKQGQCVAPIEAKIAQLQQADSNLAKDGGASDNTKNASQNGGMPPISPPQGGGGGDDKGGDTPTPAPTGNGLNCSNTGAERFSDCNEQFVSKCGSDMSATGCNAFADRYCNMGASSSSTGGLMAPAPGTNLVVDKKGEGLGSPFCQNVNAYRFCQQAGRGACPSCLKMNGANLDSGDVMSRAKETCPSDPMFLNAGLLAGKGSSATTVTSTDGSGSSASSSSGKDRISGATAGLGAGAAGAGAGGSLGSAGGSGSPAATDGLTGAVPESVTSGPNVNMATDGGGGSGGYGGESSSDEESSPLAPLLNPFNLADQKRLPASAEPSLRATGVRDVSKQAGPSIFAIGTTAYHTFCVRSQICKESRK